MGSVWGEGALEGPDGVRRPLWGPYRAFMGLGGVIGPLCDWEGGYRALKGWGGPDGVRGVYGGLMGSLWGWGGL